MSHYEERLENDLQLIRAEVSQMANLVERAVENAVHAVLTGDDALASATILADGHINRAMRKIDRMCHGFIAVYRPSAGHLRLMSAVFRSNILLERIGDYAVTICREAFQLTAPIGGAQARAIEAMANDARDMLAQAVQAFESGNAAMARETMSTSDQIDQQFAQQFAQLQDESISCTLRDRFALFVIGHRLARLSDQAKNLCEETIFWSTGESKAKKVYRILFIDKENSALSLMAQAVAANNYPQLGQFYSAGAQPALEAVPAVISYLSQQGMDTSSLLPSALNFTSSQWRDFHVIVSLEGPVKSYFDTSPPFHSVLLNWNVAAVSGEQLAEQNLDDVHRKLDLLIKALMFELRGEDAL